MLWLRRLCSSRGVVVAATALVTALISTGVLAGIGFAGLDALTAGRTNTVEVLQKPTQFENTGDWVTLAAGEVGVSEAFCTASWPYLTGGGLQAHGTHSLSVMSATSSYAASTGTPTGGWKITVVNPRGAEGPVTFRAVVVCMGFHTVTVQPG